MGRKDQATLLVTGATGLIGSHVVELARQKGYAVRALVRRGAGAEALLQPWGVELCYGDLLEPESLRAAVHGAQAIVHCAARVGDTGPLSDYRRVNVDATRALLDAAQASQTFARFVHVSSLGVYPARHHDGTGEEAPLDLVGLDPYTRTKAESEMLVRGYAARGSPVVVVRPGFVYGPRDRHVLPALCETLKRGAFAYVGSGERLLDNSGVRNVVDGIFLALESERAVGQVYNLTDARLVTRKEFVETVARGLGIAAPKLHVPELPTRAAAWLLDRGARLTGARKAPLLSLARYKFLALNLHYSIDKAKRELGYAPTYDFQDGMSEALAWYRKGASHHA